MKNADLHKRAARIVPLTGALILALVPSAASAHDNLGGDELAVANWMLVGAVVTVVIGVLWGIWAYRSGQFNNVEASKYTMLENADDYDAIMAEFDAKQRAALEQATMPGSTRPGAVSPDPSVTRPTTSGKTANA